MHGFRLRRKFKPKTTTNFKWGLNIALLDSCDFRFLVCHIGLPKETNLTHGSSFGCQVALLKRLRVLRKQPRHVLYSLLSFMNNSSVELRRHLERFRPVILCPASQAASITCCLVIRHFLHLFHIIIAAS